MLTCFSCFFPQGSCFLGGLALCLVRLTYGVPVLDLLTVPLHTLEAGVATTVSSVPVQLCPTWGGGGGGSYACSTRLQGGSPFMGLWPFVNKEEKAHYHI